MTRSSRNWKELPGSFDTTNSRWLFPSANRYGIPDLALPELDFTPESLVPYRTRVRDKALLEKAALHFYLEDYRFEVLWSRPVQTLSGLKPYGAVLTPDFSLYRDWPMAVQLWNTYRSRWLGAYWHSMGLNVIPTVSWSNPESFEYCFLGLNPGGIVSVSSQGVRDTIGRKLFQTGYRAMLEQLTPLRIFCYGELEPELAQLSPPGTLVTYPTRCQSLRHTWKGER